MVKAIKESWSYATDDGRFKLSGTTGSPNLEIVVTEPGYGIGASETPEIRATTVMDFNDFATIYHAVKAKVVDVSQR